MSRALMQAFAAAWGQPRQGVLITGDGRPAIAGLQRLARRRGGIAAAAVCSYDNDGPFAGISGLLQAVVRCAERQGLGALVADHAGSLAVLAPALARRYPTPQPILSVTAVPAEGVRSFGPDWATRHINGVVDLLLAVQTQCGNPLLCLGLVDLDQAGPLAGELFVHLARRAGNRPLLLWASCRTTCAAWERLQPLLTQRTLPGPAAAEHPALAPAGREEARFGRRIAEHLAAGSTDAACALLAAASEYCGRRGFAADAATYAERWLRLVADRPPARRIPALLQVANTALPLGRPAVAAAAVGELLDLPLSQRQRAACLYTLAMLHTRFYPERNLELALGYVDEALAALGDNPPADALAFYRNGKALVLLRQGRIAEAALLCQQAHHDLDTGSRPDQYRLQKAVLLDNLGRVCVALGQDREALPYFSAAIDLDPWYSELYQERGTLQQRLGNFVQALADFDRGMACAPPSPPLAASRGNLWLETGQPRRGIADFSRALELDDGLAYAYKARALCHGDCGCLAEALADYDQYLRLRPQDADALSNRGSLRHDLGDREGAMADLAAALRIDPDHVAALANRAALWVDMGHLDRALADLDRAVALAPGSEVLRQNRAQVLQRMTP